MERGLSIAQQRSLPIIERSVVSPRIPDSEVWYSATHFSEVSNGDLISLWPDSSGNNRDAIDLGGQNPTYATNIYHNNPAVRWDGGEALQPENWPAPQEQPNTIVLVGQRTLLNNDGGDNNYFTDGPSGNRHALIHSAPDGNERIWSDTSADFTFTPDTNWHIYVVVFDGTDSVMRRDGISDTTEESPGLYSYGAPIIGNRYSIENDHRAFRGYIGEYIGYFRRLSDIEINRIESALSIKWGIELLG